MARKKYVYRPVKTIIAYEGPGRVRVWYKQTPKDMDESVALARWVVSTIEEIATMDAPQPLRILVDNTRLRRPPLNREVRQIYQGSIEAEYMDKLATVSEYDTYFHIAIIKLLLLKNKDRVQHFTTFDAAKQWLGW